MRSTMRLATLTLLLAACGTAPTQADPASDSADAEPTATATARVEPSVEPSPEETPAPSVSTEPRQLLGTWRTTLAGEPVFLSLTETTYRITRGGNMATGSVRVVDDRIEFFDSSLCRGTGVYRWAITDGTLAFFPEETEPCPGRAEALLVRYPDYSPPSGG